VRDTNRPSPDPAVLMRLGEPFAAGCFEEPGAPPMRRWSRAVRRGLEHQTPLPYDGGLLYPCGPRSAWEEGLCLAPNYSFTWHFDRGVTEERMTATSGEEHDALAALHRIMGEAHARQHAWSTVHLVGGAGYTHSIPNYGRVIREGLNDYAHRIDEGLKDAEHAGDAERAGFYLGLQDVVEGIRAWQARTLDHLETSLNRCTGAKCENRDRLIEALRHVPFEPARSFYEAFVAYNVVYYLDGCDNPGRIDQELFPYYQLDLLEGRTTRDEALALMREFTINVSACGGWSAAIGGTQVDGTAAYNALTTICLEAVHGKHRPNYELRVRDDMPDAVWDAALDALATGCGQPALYNEARYLAALRDMDLGLTEGDLIWWNGGGCTETMVHGCSNVGSLDAGINLLLILEKTLQDHLTHAGAFEEIIERFKKTAAETVQQIVDDLNQNHQIRAQECPQPMRSLLIDDCIERGVEFNAGGARYNWSVVNVAGLSNVADSLAAVREVVFDNGEKTGGELMALLTRDFDGEEPFRQRLTRCPRFGNDDPRADTVAADIADFVFSEFLRHRPWRGGRFLPSCIMFETYATAGAMIGATPDGRRAGAPLGDSMGPHQGRDVHGPTAMLRSVTKLPLHLAAGTPVVNIRFSREFFTARENRRRVRELVETYFRMGGMQLQVSVLDQAVLRDAIAHPERHEDLIVRIGGYSTYFNRLSPELKQAVLERSAHTV
jgi:pyruvate-formate lyase